MSNFVAFVDSGIEKPSSDYKEDGRELARRCKEKLERFGDPEQFPVQLLILLVSPAFLEPEGAARVLEGIYLEFPGNTSLIGSSVAAVFYDNKIHPKGALLICLASRLISARVGFGQNASKGASRAISELVSAVKRDPSAEGPRLPHKLLLSFFPGTADSAIQARKVTEDLHNELWQQVDYRIRIVGGVSSSNDGERRKTTLQFANQRVYTDTVVAAQIESGVPMGDRLTNGIDWFEDQKLKISVSVDGQSIYEFDKGPPEDVLRGRGEVVLFKESSRGSDRIMAISERAEGTRKVEVLRPVGDATVLVPGEPKPSVMFEKEKEGVRRCKKGRGIETPVGSFSIKCVSHYRYRDILDLDIEQGIKRLSDESLNGNPYVGGFFDGEIATDKTGRSVFGNWGVAILLVGDEMSESSLMQRGYWSMTQHSAALSGAANLNDLLKESLELVHDLGFPGGMISFLLTDDHKTYVIAQMAKGPRFQRITDLTRRDLEGPDVLSRIAREKPVIPHFVPDSREDNECDQAAIKESGLISQCIIRLKDVRKSRSSRYPEDTTLGLFQVDMGDAAYKTALHPEERSMFESIGELVGANLDRIFSWKQNEIAHELDDALVNSLSAETVCDGLQIFIKQAAAAFGLTTGQIRMLNEDRTHLVIGAGVGEFYHLAKELRPADDLRDDSPTVAAFNDPQERPRVVNNCKDNLGHQKLLEQYQDDARMKEALLNVRSYANIPFRSSGKKIGTINLFSDESWFFKSYHERAFGALKKRISILVEHLTSKQNEKILRTAIPVLSEIKDLSNMDDVLHAGTERFRQGIGADCAALYLEDKASSLHVLRAQSQWRSGESWVGSAFYAKDESWSGHNAALDGRPRHMADLYAEYQKPEYRNAVKRYAPEIFGQPLSKTFTVEALALPLNVGGEYLGVLSLYKTQTSPTPRRSTGFITRDPDVLQHAVNRFTGLVKLAWQYQKGKWDSQATEGRSKIYEKLPSQGARNFESRVCKLLIDSLGAVEVHFYKNNGSGSLAWETGYRKDDNGDKQKLPEGTVDAAIISVERSKQLYRDVVNADEERRRYKGLVLRACVGLLASDNLEGALDIRWDGETAQNPPLVGDQGEAHLSALGRQIGWAFNQHLLTVRNLKRRLALEILAQVMPDVHALSRTFGEIKNNIGLLERETNREKRGQLTKDIRESVNAVRSLIGTRDDLAKQVVEGDERKLDLGDVIFSVLDTKFPEPARHFQLSVNIGEKVYVSAVVAVIEEILAMLIDNCANAMKGHQPRAYPGGRTSVHELRIRVIKDSSNGEEIVRVRMLHTGRRMPEYIKDQLQAIHTGIRPYNKKKRRYTFGIHLSSGLLELMGGFLDYEDDKHDGTVTVLTIPCAE